MAHLRPPPPPDPSTLANLQLTWRPIESLEAVLVARNLLDENFQLAAGFPEPGRSLFTKVRLKF